MQDPPTFDCEKLSFLVFQREMCPKSNREHWQGYAETAGSGYSIKTWQKLLSIGKSHCELRKGTQQQAADYCRKQESRMPGTEPTEFGAQVIKVSESKADALSAMIKAGREVCASKKDFIEYLMDRDAGFTIKNWSNIQGFCNYEWPVVFERYVQPAHWKNAFVPTQAMMDWKRDYLDRVVDRPKCLVLVGDSRLGKTAWARSLGHHMYWRGMSNQTCWDDEAKFILFDDIPWKFIPQKKQLLTCMGEAIVTDKYRAKVAINVNKVAIVLTNEWNWNTCGETDKEIDYWRTNLCVIEVTESLVSSTQQAIAL